MFLIAFAVFSLLCYGGRACDLTGQPMDVVAEVGAEAILTCPTDLEECTANCKVSWYLLKNKTYTPISSCKQVYENFENRFSISGGPNWTLTLSGVEPNDARKYRCKVKSNETKPATSESMTLIIPSTINITLSAASSQITGRGSGVFTCHAKNTKGADLTYKWLLDGLDALLFATNTDFELSENNKVIEFRNIERKLNNRAITCATYSGNTLVKTSEPFTIQVQDRPKTDEPIPIPSQPVVPKVPSPSIAVPEIPRPSIQTIQERNPEIDHTESGNTALFAGGGVSAVFLILLIVCLIYFLVFKGRNKTRSQSPNSRDGGRKDACAVELAETQPTTPAAAVSAKASMSSTREGVAVEPHQGDSQTQVTVQDTVPLSVVDSTPFDCGYKPRHLDPVYAFVDKSQPHTAAEQSTKVSGKDEPKSGATPAKDAGRDEVQSVQRDTNPGVKVATGSESSGKQPPSVIPYHLSKARKSTKKTEDKSEPPEQTADRGGDNAAHNDPRLKNAEGLIYADLDLSRGSPKIVNSEEEETLYAGIVNKETVGNLREGSIRHAP